jgi:excisionase family DNA binding protein
MGVPVVSADEAGLDFGRRGRRALRVSEFAELAACSPSTIHKMIQAGRLRAVRVGDTGWRIPPAVAEAFLAGDEAGYIPTQPGERCPTCGQHVWAEAT